MLKNKVLFLAVVSSIGLLYVNGAQANQYQITTIGLTGIEYTRNDGLQYNWISPTISTVGQVVVGSATRFNGGGTDLGYSAWLYNGRSTANIGLTGIEHTRNDGYKNSSILAVNSAGQAAGIADRYNGGGTQLGGSAWLYNGSSTVNIGLTGTNYTRYDGYQYNTVKSLNAAGQAAGTATRTGGGGGISAWLYNGSSTVNIGLTGTENTRSGGFQSSTVFSLNDAGQVVGTAERYNGGGTQLGYSAWLYNGSNTANIGLTGVEQTRSDGYKYSNIQALNAAGKVIGTSQRYNGSGTNLGNSAWLYNGSSTVNIGLTGTEFTRNDGYKSSSGFYLNAASQVAGTARRYNSGGADLGYSAWFYNGSSTTNIGLTDTEHTSNGGYKSSYISSLNAAGKTAGTADRYNGGGYYLGNSVWLYNGSGTIKIGLTDAEHTRYDDYKNNSFQSLSSSGQVTGFAERYNGGGQLVGRSAWLYNGSSTVNIGLTDAEHTGYNDDKTSFVSSLNDAGQAMGTAWRYNGGGMQLGYSTWLYNGSSTVNIGLTGMEHTRDDGYKNSGGAFLNASGQVIGGATRYNGGAAYLGATAWFYDPTLTKTFDLDFSFRNDGYAYSKFGYLGNDGLALGYYELFDSVTNTLLGNRAFSFTVKGGAHDLGSLVEGGLGAAGWDSLADAVRTNDLGQIVGSGLLTGMPYGSMAYILTPVPATVPVPATAWLLGSGLLGLISVARRKAA